MASIAMGLDYHTAGDRVATAAKMRTYTDDQSGGTGSDDARQAWDRGYDQSLRVMDGSTFADVLDDLKAGRVVHLDVWAASVGQECLSGSGAYGHTVAVLPDHNGDGWAVGDPWCTGGYGRIPQADLQRGAEYWGGQVYSLAADEPDYPSGGPGPRDPRVLVIVQRIVRRLMTQYDPSKPAPAPPGRDTGGGAVLYTTTKVQSGTTAPEEGDDMAIQAASGLTSNYRIDIAAGVAFYADANLTAQEGSMSAAASVVYVGGPIGETEPSRAVLVTTGTVYDDGEKRATVVYVDKDDVPEPYRIEAPVPVPPSDDELEAALEARDAEWREWLLAGSPGDTTEP